MTIATLGLDLGKVWIFLGLDHDGRIVLQRRVRRARFPTVTANLPKCVLGMEASCGAHFLGRALAAQRRLMPPQYVKPYVKTNKNDYRDAEANAEAVLRPTMRFVPFKSEEQLDLQTLHRWRRRLIVRRTSLINQMRAFLLERGIAVAQGPKTLQRRLPEILADDGNRLSPRCAASSKRWQTSSGIWTGGSPRSTGSWQPSAGRTTLAGACGKFPGSVR